MPSLFHYEPPDRPTILFPQNKFFLHYQHPQRLGEGQVPRRAEMEYESDAEMEFQSGKFMEYE